MIILYRIFWLLKKTTEFSQQKIIHLMNKKVFGLSKKFHFYHSNNLLSFEYPLTEKQYVQRKLISYESKAEKSCSNFLQSRSLPATKITVNKVRYLKNKDIKICLKSHCHSQDLLHSNTINLGSKYYYVLIVSFSCPSPPRK